jgi:hypothetical protein
MACATVACDTDKYEESLVKVEDRFTLVLADTAGVRSDGASPIRVQLNKTIATEPGSVVTYTTTKGAFETAEVPIGELQTVGILHVGREPGLYSVKASVKTAESVKVEKTASFRIRPALPDSIRVEVQRSFYNLRTEQIIPMKTLLKRRVGKVSAGTAVQFRSYQLNAAGDTIRVGRFQGILGNTSIENETLADVSLVLDTGNIDTLRTLSVQALTRNDRGQRVSTTQRLNYRR